jgi:transcriptional regulator with XRE-family HTH domain
MPRVTSLTLSDQLEPVAAGIVAGLAVTNRAPASVAVAIEFGRAGGGWAGAIVFNLWLGRQMRMRRMSQRQLAALSGVDHSTISRLIRGDRMPSLGTATKLARGLRELRDDADTPQYLRLVSAGATNPTTRVEYALRADEWLSEAQVRQIMEYYLAVRIGRLGRPGQGPDATERGPQRPGVRTYAQSPVGAGTVVRGSQSPSARPLVRPVRPGRY